MFVGGEGLSLLGAIGQNLLEIVVGFWEIILEVRSSGMTGSCSNSVGWCFDRQ
ncbi:MAG: hypothetical protein WBL95_12275 [Microcoleus sp.]